ncbi:MAG: PspC domain-containing protein [bacterium]|nr:PspC domain-containing protein [bacterium]
MKDITRIHLAKTPYEIEVEAKQDFEKYLNQLKKYADESIFEDVEIRITEILAENGVMKNDVISKNEVKKIEAQIGSPEIFKGEDYDDAKEPEFEAQEKREESYFARINKKRLFRIYEGQILSGVGAGLAEFFEIDATLMRVILLVSFLATAGITFWIYLLLAIITPYAKNANDVLRLRGQPITAEKIREVNEEFDFEKIKRNSSRIKRVILAIIGVGASMAALGGIFALIFGNSTLFEVSKMSNWPFDDQMHTVVTVLCNLAGVAFVLFNAALAHACFTARFVRGHAIALIASVLIGATSFFAAINFYSRESMQNFNAIRENISSTVILGEGKKEDSKNGIKTKDLAKITRIESDVRAQIRYHVSEETKIEVREYAVRNGESSNDLKFEIRNGVLKISRKNPAAFFDQNESIDIYGPALNKISVNNAFEYSTSKDQDALDVILESGSANFEMRGTGIVKDLKVFERDSKGRLVQKNVEQGGENEN